MREIKETKRNKRQYWKGRDKTAPPSREGAGQTGRRKGNPRQLGIHDLGVVLRNLDYKRSNGTDHLIVI